MKRFLKNIFLFCICGLCLNLMAYYFIAKPLLYNTYYPSIDELSRYKCFLLSDSHGQAINKKDLAEIGIYNFSFDSDSYVDMFLKLHFLIKKIGPETIFISADDHTLSPYRTKMNNKCRSIRFCNATLYKKFYGGNYFEYIFQKYIRPYCPLLDTNNSKLFYLFLTSFFRSEKPGKNHIKRFSNLTYAQKIAACKNRMQYQFSKKHCSKLQKRALLDIIKLCKKKGITLVGIKFPLTGMYIKLLKNISYHADTILKKYGVKVIDLKYSFEKDDDLFANQDHLNKLGSKLFVLKLKHQCFVNHISCSCRDVHNKDSESNPIHE